MQTVKINSLLELFTENKNKPKIKAIDFLFQLLKNIDNKDLKKELILQSNLSKEEKSLLLKNFLNFDTSKKNFLTKNKFELPKEEFKFKKTSPKINLPHEEFKKINEKKFNLPHEEFKFKKTKTIFPSHIEILKSLLQDNFNQKSNDKKLQFTILRLPKPAQLEIIKEIKKILISKSSQNKTIKTLTTLKEFKNANNIGDIINLTKKLNLNLSKIIFSQNKPIKKTFPNEILHSLFSQSPKIKQNIISKKYHIQTKPNQSTLTKLINEPQIEKKSVIKNDTLLQTDKKSTKSQKKENDSDITQLIHPNELKQKAIEAKQTLKHFASTLKEAVENYKPPVSKLTLELHPKEIGKVEVTIKQRGENLQVQISTNNQTTINFLTSQQQELKNNLVNMGFTNINMDFNSNNQQKKQNHQQKQNQYQNITEDNEELIIDFSYKYA